MLKKSDVFFLSLLCLAAGHVSKADKPSSSGTVVRMISEQQCLLQIAALGAGIQPRAIRPQPFADSPSRRNRPAETRVALGSNTVSPTMRMHP